MREIVHMISKNKLRTWDRLGWDRISPLDAADKADLLVTSFGRTWKQKHHYLLLHSCENNSKHKYLQASTHYLKPPGNIFEGRRRRPSSPLLPSSPKRIFLQKVIVLSDQSGRRQQEGWRLEEVRHHKPGCSRLTIHDEKGESAEIVEVPWRRGFHVKSIDLTLSNPINPRDDKACCPCWQRKTR